MDNDKRTHGLWEATAAAAPATSLLSSNILADVAIVGGGFTGCSAALHLAEAGKKVVLLEAKEIGFGASGRNVGLVNAGMWVLPDYVSAELGAKYGERMLRGLGEAPALVFDLTARHQIECEATRKGTLHCAVGSKGLREINERASQWQQRGADVVLLDDKQTREAIGSNAYAGALLDRRAGTVHPLSYVRGLAATAIRLGGSIFTRSPATALEKNNSGWRVLTPCGSVSAPIVIIATDTNSKTIWPELRSEQVMLPYFNFATEPLTNDLIKGILPERSGAWDTRLVMSSFRLDEAGRLIFGSIGALRGPGFSIHRDWAKRALFKLFPQLEVTQFEHEWFGWIGMTDNSLPRFHQLASNIFSINGYNGRGIAPGTVFGRDLANLAIGQIDTDGLLLPLTDFKYPAARSIREAAYEHGSTLFHFSDVR